MGEGGVGRDFEILYAHCNCALVRFFFLFWGEGFSLLFIFFPFPFHWIGFVPWIFGRM